VPLQILIVYYNRYLESQPSKMESL